MSDLRVLSRLNAETRMHHADADGDIDELLFRPGASTSDYQTYLARAYGFVAPLEAALLHAPGLHELVDLRARAKAALIVADLVALGMSLHEVARLPVCTTMPVLRGPASALGWMYVLERPLLSAAVIRGHLAPRLPVEMQRASSYLQCYRGNVGTMWRDLGMAMERVAVGPAVADRIVNGAAEAFRMLSRWRSHGSRAVTSGSLRIAG